MKKLRHIKLSRNKVAIVFDKRKPPVTGDTITIGNLIAEFKPMQYYEAKNSNPDSTKLHKG